ncbi:NAD(+)/NADH kinase [Streptomyces sp. AC495_CC817]|uniref:ATP-NAD kinase family protein n=1 Tax=Streptomyces sp. AC495_CC817 TaxID=2823900 RepID=UPI0027E0E702|nr:NAD(+)/NADH kinase [Streptomyces sp. AC495_CC817]
MIGLVVNPVAGVGGPAGLAGSDGADVQSLALARGSRSRVQERAAVALAVLAAQHPGLVVVTAAGAMGADAVRAAGLVPRVEYSPAHGGPTGSADTTHAVAALAAAGADLVLVVGGDGTLRDAASALALVITQDGGAGSGSVGAERARLAPDLLSCAREAGEPEAGGPELEAGEPVGLVVGGDGTLRDAASALALFATQDEAAGSGSVGAERARLAPDLLSCAREGGGLEAGVPELEAGEPGPEAGVPELEAGGPEAGGREAGGPGGGAVRTPAVLGVPAGVKMYSPVFAVSPAAAGALAADWVQRGGLPTEEREVLDIDEAAMRRARVEPVLHGLLRVPVRRGRTQARKAPTPASEAAAVEAAARGAVARMRPGVRYLLGPGGTTAEVARQLGVEGTPLGVDVVLDGALVRTGASEQQLLAEAAKGPAQAVVTVIGGQGFLLGRGNQQLSAPVLRALGDDPLLVVAPEQKIIDLHGRPLLVDTGDADLDARLAGHVRIITGVGTSSLYAVTSSHTL